MIEGVNIKFVFWNIYKKNLIGPIVQIILENNVDIIALAETETLDVQAVLNSLKLQTYDWKVVEICPETDICLLAKSNIHISVYKEEKRFATYKIYCGEEVYLFSVVHLASPMFLDEHARDMRAINISQVLRKMELLV